ncbi:MAG: replication initiation protein, partial [Fusobacteriaceae bacterium]
MGKIVEYDSKLNNLNFGKFKEKELDLFFAICYKLKEQGLDEITLSFQELKELSNYSRNDVKRLICDIESTYTKLLDIKLEIIISPKVREKFVLFTKYRIDEEKKEMTIQLHKEYSFVLNDIDKFTKFDLIEFSNLKSSYARNMFR